MAKKYTDDFQERRILSRKFSSIFATSLSLSLCLISAITMPSAGAKLNISTSDQALFKDLLAGATSQYNGTLTASTVFPGDYNFVVTSKKPSSPPPPPPPSNPVLDGTAFDRCFVHGWVFGSENEREDIKKLLQGLEYDVVKSSTCGGLIGVPDLTVRESFLAGCSIGYQVAGSTIAQRDGLPPPVLVPPFPPLTGGN